MTDFQVMIVFFFGFFLGALISWAITLKLTVKTLTTLIGDFVGLEEWYDYLQGLE